MNEGPLTSRTRPGTLMLWASVLGGVVFAAAIIGGFYLVAYDHNPPAPVPTRSASPSASSSSPSPSPSTSASDELANVNTSTVDFAAQAQAWICHTPTVSKPVVRSAPNRLLVTARVQWALERMGQNPGPIDGWFTGDTSQAVGSLQGSNGIAPDGRVGPTTWPIIEQSICNGPVTPLPEGTVLLDSDPESDSFAADAYAILCMGAAPPVARADAQPQWQNSLVQFMLAHLAVADLRVDGEFGAETAAAVRQYQQSSSIPVSGVVDAATWKQLRTDACH